MVAVPVRAIPVFWATLSVTVPFPVPLAPAVIVTNKAWLVAVHGHPGAAETPTLTLPPRCSNRWTGRFDAHCPRPSGLIHCQGRTPAGHAADPSARGSVRGNGETAVSFPAAPGRV